ncbi:MAG: hypothetical protein ACI4CA_08525 [Bacteroides sp.]
MEKLMLIKQVFPVQERPYTDKSGNAKLFTSRAFVLTDGIDTLCAEMQGDLAKANAQTPFEIGSAHTVQLQVSVRTWRDTSGTERYSNEARIVKMS